VIAVVLAVVFAGSTAVFLSSRLPAYSRISIVVGHGRATLDVPLMTLYTAPKMPNAQVESWVNWSVASTQAGPSTMYVFQWNAVRQPSLPVSFVLNSTTEDRNLGTLAPGSIADGFMFYPAGTCRGGCDSTGRGFGAAGAGIHDVLHQIWRMDYTVRRITDVVGSMPKSYLEVEFSIALLQAIGESLPAANVTLPGPSDLLEAPGISSLAAYAKVTMSARATQSSHHSYSHDSFRNNVTTVDFDAGPQGIVTAQLSSRYRWSSVDDYVLSFMASKETWIRSLFDLRFGSLLIEYLPPPA
jgi:hypothetical protein